MSKHNDHRGGSSKKKSSEHSKRTQKSGGKGVGRGGNNGWRR